MSRPDPQVDIAFMLMDKKSTGSINLSDFKSYVDPSFDLNTDFIKRFFGQGRELRIAEFSQFLVEVRARSERASQR
jgi:Ca2+-binding EF-hand superfamily protein